MTVSFLVLVLLVSLILPCTLAIICEDLPQDLCAFAISASSQRCLLESIPHRPGVAVEYQCRTSGVVVETMSDWVETDACVSACGVDRNSIGISSDALMEPHFTSKLCAVECYDNCPNIINLYFNLAAGEGVYLPDICEAQRANPQRAVLEFLGSGAAPSPVAGSDNLGYSESSLLTGPSPIASPPASA
ncbi:hypothetical protein J5N97_002476 [Dioscorea zingiberensis]|uniref:PAR1 protein n=1 Tax=Dioscorea zingiberensis TaxID=325984 RepID=A0A9D5HP87_9LILI|nr:hypothetical protein J5N97_002476 [Dioscorea zingiberensis]